MELNLYWYFAFVEACFCLCAVILVYIREIAVVNTSFVSIESNRIESYEYKTRLSIEKEVLFTSQSNDYDPGYESQHSKSVRIIKRSFFSVTLYSNFVIVTYLLSSVLAIFEMNL